jgi:endonuclease/exonuclease/phosphatase family metal-dependent hydrolase
MRSTSRPVFVPWNSVLGKTARRAALLLLVPFSLVGEVPATPKSDRPAVAAEAGDVRIGTYNVLAGTRDPKGTAEVIRKLGADIVALQELAPEGAKLLDVELKDDFSHRYFSNGHGLLSRYPILDPRFERSERGINGFLFAEIDLPRGHLQIASMHLDPLRIWTTRQQLTLPLQLLWRQGDIHRAELAQVAKNLHPGLPTILLGDFNSASHTAPGQLRDEGYTDSFAAVTKKPDRTKTLHFRVVGINTGHRIDYIFHDKTFETISSRVFPGPPSDHDPVMSTLRWKKTP